MYNVASCPMLYAFDKVVSTTEILPMEVYKDYLFQLHGHTDK